MTVDLSTRVELVLVQRHAPAVAPRPFLIATIGNEEAGMTISVPDCWALTDALTALCEQAS